MEKKKVLMLGAGALQVPAIQELKKLGAYVLCLDWNPKAEGFRYADAARIISTLDVEAVTNEFVKQKMDIIMTSASDAPVRVVSEVSEKLNLPCKLSYEDACAVTIKSLMRERLKRHGVPVPKYAVLGSLGEFLEAFYDVFGGRCIIKPSDNAGSRGVKLIEGAYSKEELEEEYNTCKRYARNGVLLAEEVMDGLEVSVESLTVGGRTEVIAITDKVVCQRPYFVEIGHVEGSRLPTAVREGIKQVATQAINAMNIQNGPSHTEVIVTEEGPKIVEIAARLGGDFITSALVPLSTGVNIVRESVKLELGEEACLNKKWDRGAAVCFLASEKEGTLLQVERQQESLRMEGIREVAIYRKAGERVNALRSSNDRIGHIIAEGETAEEAWRYVQMAYEKINFIVG